MTNLYENHGSAPKFNAQRNLCGRTHYVDDDTLRFHKSRVISARATDNGLLFAIVTSDARDYQNTKRCFRFVIFDLFGKVICRPTLDEGYSSSAVATKHMWAELNRLDAKAITRAAIADAIENHSREMAELEAKIDAVQS